MLYGEQHPVGISAADERPEYLNLGVVKRAEKLASEDP
jgi:hypothetical protein